ncbi:Tubulin alpha chain [Pelomyxa schiedti]|nr:Tubulin alpha chain [Pelomyxa schiedti]
MFGEPPPRLCGESLDGAGGCRAMACDIAGNYTQHSTINQISQSAGIKRVLYVPGSSTIRPETFTEPKVCFFDLPQHDDAVKSSHFLPRDDNIRAELLVAVHSTVELTQQGISHTTSLVACVQYHPTSVPVIISSAPGTTTDTCRTGTISEKRPWVAHLPAHIHNPKQSLEVVTLHGAALHGTARHSTARHGMARRGAALHGTALHGAARRGTARHCTARHGTALHCTARHGTALHCTARHGTARHCTARHGTARHGTALHGAARHGTALHGAARRGTALHCTARRGAARHGTARHGTARHGTARHGTALHGTALHCTARRGAARHGTARHGTARHGTALHGAARHGTARRGTALHSTALHCTALHGTALHHPPSLTGDPPESQMPAPNKTVHTRNRPAPR